MHPVPGLSWVSFVGQISALCSALPLLLALGGEDFAADEVEM